MSIERLIKIAKGLEKADLVLKNAKIVNVFSHEILDGDVAIANDSIAGIGNYEGIEERDIKGRFVMPGFIDGHIHLESSMVTVPEFARAVVPTGTTTIIADPHEIANVFGMEGITYILKSSKHNPLHVYITLPSCVPTSELETAGSELKAIDLYPFLSDKWVLGLGEVMNYPGVLSLEPDIIDKIKLTKDRVIEGHSPGIMGRDLVAYIASGIGSDHECTRIEEARERLRLGMHIMVREGSATKNLEALLPLVTESNSSRFSLVTDDRHPEDILSEGHMDHLIRKSINLGIDPITAVRMATINTAHYFKLPKIGAIAPGYKGDLAVVDDLKNFRVTEVYKSGELIAEHGELIKEIVKVQASNIRGSVNIKWLTLNDFKIKDKGGRCRIIRIIPDQIHTDEEILRPLARKGFIVSDLKRDIIKLAVIERHKATGNIGLGLIHGLGLKKGALASSVAHDSHNIIVAGVTDEDILAAAAHIARIQGGLAISEGGKIIDCLQLPIAGLMSDKSLVYVKEKLSNLDRVARELGAVTCSPFMNLSFLSLPVIPKLKLTDKGLVDVTTFSLVDLFIDSNETY